MQMTQTSWWEMTGGRLYRFKDKVLGLEEAFSKTGWGFLSCDGLPVAPGRSSFLCLALPLDIEPKACSSPVRKLQTGHQEPGVVLGTGRAKTWALQ